MSRQASASSESITAAPAMTMVKITRLLAKMTKVRNVVTAHSYWFFANVVVASMPPSPIVSTADEGTMTIEPFSLMAS